MTKAILRSIIIYLFHPIFTVFYTILLVYYLIPESYISDNSKNLGYLWIQTFALTVLFPLVSLSSLKIIGLIQTWNCTLRNERISLYIATGIFYLWFYFNIKDNYTFPVLFSRFMLGVLFSLFIAFFINIFKKPAIHPIGIANIFYFVFHLFYQFDLAINLDNTLIINYKTIVLIFLFFGFGYGWMYYKIEKCNLKSVIIAYLIGIVAQMLILNNG